MIRRLMDWLFGDPDRDAEREETNRVREESAQVTREARTAIHRAKQPTGVPLRDLLAGDYDPQSDVYRGRSHPS